MISNFNFSRRPEVLILLMKQLSYQRHLLHAGFRILMKTTRIVTPKFITQFQHGNHQNHILTNKLDGFGPNFLN